MKQIAANKKKKDEEKQKLMEDEEKEEAKVKAEIIELNQEFKNQKEAPKQDLP